MQKDNPWFSNASYSINGVWCIIREDKKEPGNGGDGYMQIARDFQLYVSQLREKIDLVLEDGAPKFLCIFGMLPLHFPLPHLSIFYTLKGPSQ